MIDLLMFKKINEKLLQIFFEIKRKLIDKIQKNVQRKKFVHRS